MEQREGQAHCGQCKTYKPHEEFSPSQRHNGGWCRACHKARYRMVRPAQPDRPCEVCERPIEEPLPRQRFCSEACKMKARYWRLNPRQPRACALCGTDITAMRRDARYCSNACSVKAKDQARTPRQRRDQHLRSQYGITHDEYDAMLAKQGGGCAICGDDGAGSRCGVLHVDHCHNSSAIRGLLCESCNLALGKFRDDPELLRRAAEYIEKGKA